jgi:RHS repeat-associated protein
MLSFGATTKPTAEGRVRSRWRYEYDALGRRTAEFHVADDGAVAERVEFTWDSHTLVEQSERRQQEPDSTAATITWEHDGLVPLVQLERDDVDQRFYAIVADLVGAPTELVSPDGTIAWRAQRGIWGADIEPTDGGATTPLRFPGQYADPETGWHYNVYRHYDPATARYVAPDPIGITASYNQFTYPDNPTSGTDPLELAPCSPGEVQNVHRGPSQENPGGQLGAAVSIPQVRQALGRAGMSVREYDIVHVPEIRTPDGLAFGNSPHSMDGFPMRGPRGLPLIEISDMGLRSMDEAVATIFHEIAHHRHFDLTRNSANVWGGSEAAAEAYGQQMLDQFHRRTG